ncbi:MAG TPA: FHA domain-containing protein [Anaerolineales bacterium]|nr:FHA domain-containing protein [Anaerolineales bacterium]
MAAQFQFVMRSGPNVGKVFPLEAAEISIGRDNSNMVAINDAEVSRKHAKMEFRGSAYVITDLGSTNGTFINGNRVSGTQVLNPGDTVSFGEGIVLQYEAAYDPNATVISSSAKASKTVAPVQRQAAAPVPAPAAPPAYSGQVPAGPAAAAPAKKGSNKVVIIVLVVVLVCLILGCIALFFWVDADKTGARWCMFPFRFIAQMIGGTCQ